MLLAMFADEFLAPGESSSSNSHAEPASQRMTNEDFRKLMMTPRAGGGSASSRSDATPKGSLGAAAATPRWEWENILFDLITLMGS